MIKTLAVNAKKDFKKKKMYRYYCEEMIDRWIPDLKRVMQWSVYGQSHAYIEGDFLYMYF